MDNVSCETIKIIEAYMLQTFAAQLLGDSLKMLHWSILPAFSRRSLCFTWNTNSSKSKSLTSLFWQNYKLKSVFRFDNQISTLPTDLYTVLLKNVDNLLIMWITYLCMFHVEQMQLDTKKGRPIYSVSPSAWCIYIITLELNTLINSSYPCFYY